MYESFTIIIIIQHRKCKKFYVKIMIPVNIIIIFEITNLDLLQYV